MQDPKTILTQFWGYENFRPPQEAIIQHALERKDGLALLPTGGGKSMCYQVPGLCQEGLVLVISPLIALMKDQVAHLRERGIQALAVFSGMSQKEIDTALDNAVYGDYKFLYCSPERIKTDMFLARLPKMNVSLVAIDEAHCISQWGYDFRPAYLEIASLREYLPQVPFLALTASATPKVQEDILEKLALQAPKVFHGEFLRENLSYSVFHLEDKERKMLEIAKRIGGSGLVYVASRKDAVRLSALLRHNRVNADFYHAGLEPIERSRKQEGWTTGDTRVMVATNAFGMGIDKGDVRFVIHFSPPRALEAYYQEAGRAGRDGKKAFAVLLYHHQDLDSLNYLHEQSYPEVETIKRVYQALCNYYNLAVGSHPQDSLDFELDQFSKNYGIASLQVYYALQRMEEAGLVQLNESFFAPSKVKILIDSQDMYRFQVANGQYDGFLKSLLRAYGGELYGNYVVVAEEKIGRAANIANQEVVKILHKLRDLQVVDYIPRKTKPQLTFTAPRMSADRLPVSERMWAELKARDQEKLNGVMNYVLATKRCRAAMLNEYFGENAELRCGICDNCLGRHEETHDSSGGLEDVVLGLLRESDDVTETDVVEHVGGQPEMTIAVIRTMLDRKILYFDAAGKLKIK